MGFGLPRTKKEVAAIGIEINDDLVKAVEISQNGGVFSLDNFAITPLPSLTLGEGGSINGKILTIAVSSLLKKNGFGKHPVALCLPNSQVFIKRIAFPVSTREAIEKIITDDFHLHFHFSSATEAYFDFAITDKGKANSTEAIVVVSKRKVLDGYLLALQEAGLEISTVGVDYFALQNFFEINHDMGDKTNILVAMGKTAAIINIVKKGMSLLNHNFIWQEGKSVPVAISEEIVRTLTYYNANREKDFAEHIFVTGEICSAETIAFIAKNTGFCVKAVNPLSNRLRFAAKTQSLQAYTLLADRLSISIGAAIGNIEQDGNNKPHQRTTSGGIVFPKQTS